MVIAFTAWLCGCGAAGPSADGDEEELVWVSRQFSGGRQCDPREEYMPPETVSLLWDAGVDVRETAERAGAVCMACDCASYSATHYARIPAAGVPAAETAGFERSGPPDDGGAAEGPDGRTAEDPDGRAGQGAITASPTFEARGHEPGWLLEIRPDGDLHLRYDYGEAELRATLTEPVREGGRVTYHARTEGHALAIVIEATPCTAASGEIYESTVVVALDERTLRGCGRELPWPADQDAGCGTPRILPADRDANRRAQRGYRPRAAGW